MSRLIVVAVLSANRADATTLANIPIVCPACDHAFETTVVVESSSAGGIDRDLFARSFGEQPVFYLIITCPRCYYSGYQADFSDRKLVDAALRDRVINRPKLRPATAISENMRPTDIPVATRFALAAQVYEWRRASVEAQAWLHLRWAWAVREDATHLPPSAELIEAMKAVTPRLPEARTGVNQADREMMAVNLMTADLLSARFAPAIDPAVRTVIAMILCRHGELPIAVPLLDDLAERRALPEPIPEYVRRLRAMVAEERRLYTRARQLFDLAVAKGEIHARNLPAAYYLLGELCRRLGDTGAAQHWFDKALDQPGLESDLRTWTLEQKLLASGWR